MNDKVRRILRGVGGVFATLFGILGWIVQGFLEVMVLSVVVIAMASLLIYARVKPDLDYCREVAYDKLAEMDRLDFQMLSDTEVYDKDGNIVGLINSGHYEYVPINEISINIQNAYIAAEDRRFKSHNGVDWIATIRAGLALVKNRGEITQGGSTITQQVIKNTYLTQEQSFTRKITEILLAPEIEKKYSKADIMEFYCNTNFYGNHRYGVQAASKYYFGKDAANLTSWEAAVLAALSNSPSAYDPVRNPEDCLEKRNSILGEMLEVGFLTEDEYEYAISRPLEIVRDEGEGTNENYQTSYALHCAALELMKQSGFEFRYTFLDKEDYDEYNDAYQLLYNEISDDLRAGGYKIHTSLDQRLQNILQENIDSTLSRFTELQENGKYALQGAGVIVNNMSNYVVAIVGGRGTDDIYNRGFLSARQPGSTIKPLLVYTPAFDTGLYYPSRMVDDHKWDDGPSNSGNHYYGNVTIREALNRSLNTVAWQVLQDIGVNYGLDYLGRMEFQKITWVDNGVAALAIGGFTNGLRVVDMAKGYSTLANMGMYNDNTCLVSLEHEQRGELMKNHVERNYRVYDEDSAYMTTDILKGTLTLPYATGYGLALSGGMPAAGKTGTTNNSRDAWFCGYTRYYTTAVWMGYDTPRNMPGIYGATYAGRIWRDVMNEIHEGLEPIDWETPPTIEVRRDPNNGRSDLFSLTADVRAEENAHEKEQQALKNDILYWLGQFEGRSIDSVEDTYWVDEQHEKILDSVLQLDEGEERTLILTRLENKYAEFTGVESDMAETIEIYESEQAAEAEAAAIRAESQAARRQEELEAQSRRNEFLTALREIEALEYQASNAQELVNDALSKLSQLGTSSETASYRERLQAAINRISTLPTESEYRASHPTQARTQTQSQNRSQTQSQTQTQTQTQSQTQSQQSQAEAQAAAEAQAQLQQQIQAALEAQAAAAAGGSDNSAPAQNSEPAAVAPQPNVITAPVEDTSNSGPGVQGPGAGGAGEAQADSNVIIVGGGE